MKQGMAFNYDNLVERQHKVTCKTLKSCGDISVIKLSLL